MEVEELEGYCLDVLNKKYSRFSPFASNKWVVGVSVCGCAVYLSCSAVPESTRH